jgi:N-acyl homoserine lactone hydrolase
VHRDELTAAKSRLDVAVFDDEVSMSDGWQLQDAEYTVAPGVHAIASPGHTAGHMSLFVELPEGRPVILCGDAADLRENLTDEIAPGLCWQDDESRAIASIRKLNALARTERAELWPNHDFEAYRSWPQFPAWRS